MKLLHIPPSNLDDYTLHSQYKLVFELFDSMVKQEMDEVSDNPLIEKYKNHHLYILFRMVSLADELKKRNIKHTHISKRILILKTKSQQDYIESTIEIESDISILGLVWDDFHEFSPQIEEMIADLSLLQPEEVKSQLECEYENFRESNQITIAKLSRGI